MSSGADVLHRWLALAPCLACEQPIRLVDVVDETFVLYPHGVAHRDCAPTVDRFIQAIEKELSSAA